MKGRIAITGTIDGRAAAALVVDGKLSDLLIDPPESDAPRPEAIYRATVGRPLKGMNGAIVSLGAGHSGFLRQAKGHAPGDVLLVQINSQAEDGKAAPVTTRVIFKGRACLLTPGAPGRNVARSVKDQEARERLEQIAADAADIVPKDVGLILRSAAADLETIDILDEISALSETCRAVIADGYAGPPELLVDAPSATHAAWRDWTSPAPEQVFTDETAFDDHGVWDMIETLKSPRVTLSGTAFMFVEPTRAVTAIDVNTGGDFSTAAGLKANMAAVRDLPRQLRLRGLGGQITIDFAPMAKKDRKSVEQALTRALRQDGVDTIIVGWTPLGHLELQRKRARLPLAELMAW